MRVDITAVLTIAEFEKYTPLAQALLPLPALDLAVMSLQREVVTNHCLFTLNLFHLYAATKNGNLSVAELGWGCEVGGGVLAYILHTPMQ